MPWIDACAADEIDEEDVLRWDHGGRTFDEDERESVRQSHEHRQPGNPPPLPNLPRCQGREDTYSDHPVTPTALLREVSCLA